MLPRTSAVRAGERCKASPRAGVTYCLTDWYESELAPNWVLGQTCGTWDQRGTWGRRGQPEAEGGTWDRELVLLETLHPGAVEIVSDASEVVGLLLTFRRPPSAVEAKGGTARLAPRQLVGTLTAASTDGVPRTRDARSAERSAGSRRSPGDSPIRGEHTSERRSKEPAGRRQTARARHTGTGERKPDADRLAPNETTTPAWACGGLKQISITTSPNSESAVFFSI